jgi:hypothetical protein
MDESNRLKGEEEIMNLRKSLEEMKDLNTENDEVISYQQ